MSGRRPLARVGLLACGGLLLGALFLESRAVDPELDHRFERRLERLEALDTRLKQDVLRARSGMLGNYDGLVENLAALERLRAGLREVPRFVDEPGRAAFATARERYEEAAIAKAVLAERFKSTNAALQNSLVYFPIAARDPAGRAGSAADRATLRELHVAILSYVATGSETDRAAAWRTLEAAEAIGVASGAGGRLTEVARVHARNILVRKPALDALTTEIVEAPTGARSRELRASYRRASARAHERAELFGMLLYLCGAGLAGLLVFSFSALRDAKLGLEDANQRLERRVEERTAELEGALEELERSRKEQLALKDRFLSNVSHELRTPLTAVHQFVELVLDGVAGDTTPEQSEYLGLAFKNVRQLEAMIHDLMEMTRLQSGKLRVDPSPMTLTEILRETLDAFTGPARERGVGLKLDVDVDGDLPRVIADSTRVRQILNNLVENALKFTPQGGVIAIAATPETDPPGFVRVSVVDTGSGIETDQLERIFERLHQIEPDGARARPGLGLGLSICRDLVTRQGGRIWVDSEVGCGSRFHFTLPVYSIAALVRPAVLDRGRLREQYGILRVRLDAHDSESRELPTALRRWLCEKLRRLAADPTDVLVPGVWDGSLFMVAAADPSEMESLRKRVWRNLNADDRLSSHSVELDARVESTSAAERSLTPESGLEHAARRIEQLMHDSSAWSSS